MMIPVSLFVHVKIAYVRMEVSILASVKNNEKPESLMAANATRNEANFFLTGWQIDRLLLTSYMLISFV